MTLLPPFARTYSASERGEEGVAADADLDADASAAAATEACADATVAGAALLATPFAAGEDDMKFGADALALPLTVTDC